MASEKEMQSAFRRKRVRILKYLLVISMITFIVVPIVLCLILFAKVNSLEKQIDSLSSAVETYTKVQTDTVQGQVDENSSSQGFIIMPEVTTEPIPDVSDGKPDSYEEEAPQVRKVYLSFDDGPSSNTNEILDILAEYNVKATFFAVGKEGEKAEAAYKRIVDEGHTLGMHTYSHKYSTIYASVDDFAKDLSQLQEYLYNVTGVWSRYVRFPGGSSNTVSKIDMKEFIHYVNEQGLTYLDWNVSSKDATSPSPKASEIVDNCLADIDRHQTVVILMHDAAGKHSTVEALSVLIETIQAMENTEILPITEDTELVQHITISEDETEE
ncbi:MAG TPA: polysaccharide deacetylase family protein [Lachnospiraceae bacterium]|nr:polysaccharide deacetylase family protein [Lachnospiraceae bacterium]